MIFVSLLPLIKKQVWWIRIFDFPRIQFTIISAVVFPVYLWAANKYSVWTGVFLTILAACVAHQIYMMFPYTPLAAKQVQRSGGERNEDSVIKLIFANVLMSNRNSSILKKTLREIEPDIILTVETDAWWQSELKEFETTHPFIIHQPQPNTYGMLFYSRLEVVDSTIEFLVEDDIPSIHARVRLKSGQAVSLHCLHPRPPFPTEAAESTERDAELLLVGKTIKSETLPVVVMGDLNDVAWSRTNYLFQDISGLLDPRIGRGFYNTFHAQVPFLRFPLDHFFHSNHFRLVEFKRLPRFGSDHFPVCIALSFEPEAVLVQKELEADAEDERDATEKIKKAL